MKPRYILVSFCNLPTPTTSPLACVRVPSAPNETITYAPVPLGYPGLVLSATGLAHCGGTVFMLFHSEGRMLLAALRESDLRPLFYQELPEVKDGHSMLAVKDQLYVVSTGTDQLLCYDISESKVANPRAVWQASDTRADTHHVNSLAEQDGEILVSAFGPKAAQLWSSATNGYIHNVTRDQRVKEGIYHPHSLSVRDGSIYYSDSHTNSVRALPGQEAIFEFNGYTRGISWLSSELICMACSIGRRISKSTGMVTNPADPGELAGEASLIIGNILNGDMVAKVDLSLFGPEVYDLLSLESGDLDLLTLASTSQIRERQALKRSLDQKAEREGQLQAELEQAAQAYAAQLAAMQQQEQAHAAQLAAMQQSVTWLETQLSRIQASMSWRLTAPLRSVKGIWMGIRAALRRAKESK